MADSMPRMDWLSPNIGETFQLFKQKADLYFSVKKITGENQVNHILLAVGDEGLKRFNSWNLSADEILSSTGAKRKLQSEQTQTTLLPTRRK